MDDFKKAIENYLYKIYPFCMVSVTDEPAIMLTRVYIAWFYKGAKQSLVEHFDTKVFLETNKHNQDNLARHIAKKAIENIQKIIIEEENNGL